jgi:hypothetical protein
VPGVRPVGAGRVFARPAMVVNLAVGSEPATEVLETVDAVLTGRFRDLELRLQVDGGHPGRALIMEACAADPRIRLAPSSAAGFCASPFQVALPVQAVPDPGALGRIHELMTSERLGLLRVSLPRRLGGLGSLLRGLPAAASGRRDGSSTPSGRTGGSETVEVVASGALARARRIAGSESGDWRSLLGELFGQRQVAGAEAGIRRRGAPEPEVPEAGGLGPASDLAHERAEHLRQRARAYTNLERAERYAQRAVRERMRASQEKARADRLEARLARMSPRYFLLWRGKRALRRLAAAWRRLRALAEPVRHRLYRWRAGAPPAERGEG